MSDLFESLGSSTALLAALIAVTGIVVWRTYRRLGRRPNDAQPIARQQRKPDSHPARHVDTPAALARWEVKMREIERDVSARLDTKMAALEQLVIAADAATARLDTALGKSELAGRAAGD